MSNNLFLSLERSIERVSALDQMPGICIVISGLHEDYLLNTDDYNILLDQITDKLPEL